MLGSNPEVPESKDDDERGKVFVSWFLDRGALVNNFLISWLFKGSFEKPRRRKS
jgi:hypothetical protein